MNFLEKHHVDVILSDIKMTFKGGLDVAQHIYENKIPTRVILISGFQDFEIARTALKYNVVHYLLKPVNFVELKKTFAELKKTIDEDKKYKQLIETKQSQINELLPLLKKQFFVDITLSGMRDEKELLSRMKHLNISDEYLDKKCCEICFSIKNFESYLSDYWEYTGEQLYTAIQQIVCDEHALIECTPVRASEQKLYFVLFDKNHCGDDFTNAVNTFFDDVVRNLKNILALDGSFSIVRMAESLIKLSHLEVFADEDGAIRIDESMLERQRLFMSYIVDGDIDGAKNILNFFISQCMKEGITETQSFLLDTFAKLNIKISEMISDSRIIFPLKKLTEVKRFQLVRLDKIGRYILVSFVSTFECSPFVKILVFSLSAIICADNR